MTLEKITYAGHSAVFVTASELEVAIDPWLSTNPSCLEALKNPAKLDLIVLTHGHSDHASDAAALAKKHRAQIAATWELAMIMVREGVPESQIIAMNKGGSVHLKGLKITLTHAFHSSSYDTEKGPVYAGEPCGVVLDDGQRAIYHAGDTALFSDMKLIRDMHAPAVALLPIGDRFTMGPREAAVAARLIGAEVVIPIHHSTFGLLTGTPEEFVQACREVEGVEVVVLSPGESYAVE